MMDVRTKRIVTAIIVITVVALIGMTVFVLLRRAAGSGGRLPPSDQETTAPGSSTGTDGETLIEDIPSEWMFNPTIRQDTPPAPTPADSDHDGLSDEFEATIGSDPSDPDTDGDGITDADDHVYGSGPTTPDTSDPRASRTGP
jgi:hypothetical protein